MIVYISKVPCSEHSLFVCLTKLPCHKHSLFVCLTKPLCRQHSLFVCLTKPLCFKLSRFVVLQRFCSLSNYSCFVRKTQIFLNQSEAVLFFSLIFVVLQLRKESKSRVYISPVVTDRTKFSFFHRLPPNT